MIEVMEEEIIVEKEASQPKKYRAQHIDIVTSM